MNERKDNGTVPESLNCHNKYFQTNLSGTYIVEPNELCVCVRQWFASFEQIKEATHSDQGVQCSLFQGRSSPILNRRGPLRRARS